MAHLRAGPAGSGWCRYRAGAHHLAALVALLATSCAAATTGPVAIRVLPPAAQQAAFVPAYREPPPAAPAVAAPAPWVPHPAPTAASRSAPVPRETPPTTQPVANQLPTSWHPAAAGLPAGLLCIRHRESTDNYRARSGPYSGAYQYDAATWGHYGGYGTAGVAPPAVQDAKALAGYNGGTAARHQLWPNTSRACGL